MTLIGTPESSKYIITYDGVIKAGYDLSKVKAEVNGTNVTVTLPEPKILSHTIDYDSLQIMDEQYSIFNPVEITDYNSFYASQRSWNRRPLTRDYTKRPRPTARP